MARRPNKRRRAASRQNRSSRILVGLTKGLALGAAAVGIFSAGIGVGMLFDKGAPAPNRAAKEPVPIATAAKPKTTETRAHHHPTKHPGAGHLTAPVVVPKAVAPLLPPPPPGGAWIDNALAYTPVPGAPLIAIVLDDMGLDRSRSERATRVGGPLTLSYLSYADDLVAQTGSARARGHELLVHLPMEPEGEDDPGPGALLMRLDETELRERIAFALGRFPGFIGINNHMGSRFTADPDRMRVVFEALRPKGYLFLDSLTTPRTRSLELGRELSVPTLARDVFLDDVNTEDEVWFRLLQAEAIAEKTGTAIAIGHPRDATLAVLEDWIAELGNRASRLAPLSAVARVRLERHQQVMNRQ